MQYEAFIELVQDRGGLRERALAEDVTRATLETLGERLSAPEAVGIAAQLPEDLGGCLKRHASPTTAPSDFGVEDFYRKVAEHHGSGLSPQDAREPVRAVLITLREAISEGGYATLLASLPQGYGDLFR